MSSKPWTESPSPDPDLESVFLKIGSEMGETAGGDLFAAAGVLCAHFVLKALISLDKPKTLPKKVPDRHPDITAADPQTRQILNSAMRTALLESIIDIGGGGTRHCFMEKGARIGVPVRVIYPLSGGRNLWHTRDPRAGQACICLRRLADHFSSGLSSEETFLPSVVSLSQYGENFFTAQLVPVLPPTSIDIPDFLVHLRYWVLARAWYHLGNTLITSVYAKDWEAFIAHFLKTLLLPPGPVQPNLVQAAAGTLAELISAAGAHPLDENFEQTLREDADISRSLKALGTILRKINFIH